MLATLCNIPAHKLAQEVAGTGLCNNSVTLSMTSEATARNASTLADDRKPSAHTSGLDETQNANNGR
jgi:hypothetical protein